MMSSYEQPTTPEKLPGIDKLAIKLEESVLPSSAYLPPPPSTNYYNNVVYHQHLSPPLTPAVSPSSVLIDSMQFKRKFSVDVGPFGFGTNIPHPSSMHDQDAYRRSSCSAVSIDCQSDYNHFLDAQQQQQYSPIVNQQKASKRGSRAQLSGPNTQHKHACKYPYCIWSFKRYEHLKRHMLVHTGKRPHSCHFPGCGKNFSRSDNFHAHYRTHTKKSNLIQTTKRKSITAPTAVFDDTRTPAYFATKQQQLQQQQSFDMTSYQDMYSQSYGSEQSDDYPNTQYMRNNFTHQPFSQQANTVENNTAGVSSLLNHEVVNNNNSFYSSDYNNNNNNINYYQPYPTSTNDNSSIAAAVAVVAAAASTTTTSTTTNSRRSSSSNSISSSNNQQKSHICPVSQCQRRFKRLEHLKRHMRIHTLERPFGCSFPNCHKTFSRSDNLSQHMKTHQRVEDRRRRQQRNDEPMKQQHLPPLQEQNNNNMMVGMNWHNTGTVGC